MKALAEEIEDSYPLSPMQQGMVFHSLYHQHSGVDIDQMVYTLHEQLDSAAFMQAWRRVVERHASLRTSFRWQGLDEPVQEVHRSASLEWSNQDWRQLSGSEQQQRLAAYLLEDRRRGFELTEDSLNRFALFRVGDTDFKFVWTFHHATLDGRALVLVLKEVFAYYEALLNNRNPELPLPRPYRDFIEWLAEQDLSGAESFWRATLKTFTSPTPLVVNRAESNSFNDPQDYTEQEVYLSAEFTSALRALAKEHDITLNNILQGAWALLLSHYSGEEDVVFGATRACRRTAVAGADSMVGPFINTLPLRVKAPPDMEVMEWLRQIRQQHITLREYEHTPLLKIQECSEIPRGKSLFGSILVFENYEFDSYFRAQGGRWANREFKLHEKTNYPLTLSGGAGPQLLLRLAYDRRNFDDATIARMLRHIQTLLEGFAADPRQRLSEVPMLTREEERQILIDWNDTEAEDAAGLCIHQLFEAQAERTPDAVAVMFEDEQVTYRELNARANQLARHLRAAGARTEQLVAVMMERSIEAIIGLLGVLKAGAAYVPIDPAYPKERLEAMLQDARPSAVLTNQGLLDQLPETDSRIICPDLYREQIAHESRDNPVAGVTAGNLAYVIYTSGSTGTPKGVMIEHRSLVNYTVSGGSAYTIAPGDRVLQFASLSFDASAEEIYPCLTRGATLVLRTESMISSISTFLQTCRELGITVLDLPTAFWHNLVERLGEGDVELPPSIRLVIIGGERARPERLAEWQKQVGARPRLINTYGPTEATIVATACELTATSPASEVPIGRPVRNAQVYVLDRHLRPVPVGVPGELHIGGAGIARGYLNRPELTAESFIQNPFSKAPGARLYKSGDVARFLPDGQLEFCGRQDRQVKIHGFRIELGDIEPAIARHPKVREVIVLAHEDVPGDRRLVAYVIPAPECAGTDPALLSAEFRAYLKGKLPAYMIPSAFMTLEALPVNANGKVNEKALPVPEQASAREDGAYVKPGDPLQYQLVQIWEEVFDIRPIGITDNFFDLGGHSLLSVRLMDRIEQVFDKKLPLATLFAGATIEHLAEALLEQGKETTHQPLVPIQTGGSRTPFFYLHGDFKGGGLYCLRLAKCLGAEQPFYAIQPHGIDGRPIPATIEEMAAEHLKTLRDFQSEGPYRLGGHCNGGLLVFEMARQLEADGQEVDVLILIGASGANARYRILQNVLRRFGSLGRLTADEQQQMFLKMRERLVRLSEIQRYYAGRLKELSQVSVRAQLSFLRQNGLRGLRSFAAMFGGTTGVKEEGRRPVEVPQGFDEAYLRAMLSYVPRKYSGKVTLLWPSEWAQEGSDDPTIGWCRVAAEVDVRIVPGGHLTCIINHMDELAQQITACLRKSPATDRPASVQAIGVVGQ